MSILAPSRRSPSDVATFVVGAVVVGFAFLLYFMTAARDIVVGDTPELITAAVTLGVPHPPGYPLFTMLGHLFSLLPLGPIPFRVNLLAVTCDALTVGIVYLTAWRLCANRMAAAIAALVLAVTPIFWAWSIVTDVFPLNNLLASLLIYLLVMWRERPDRTVLLVAMFFVGGLALANHQTIVLLGPAFGFVLWQGRAVWWRRPQILAICAIAFLVGLLPYLYVPWAAAHNPVINWGGVSSLKDLIALIARQSYGTMLLAGTTGFMAGSPMHRICELCLSFGPLMGPLVLLGLIQAYRQQRWYFWFSLLAFAGTGLFFVAIANLNLETYPHALFVLERFFLLSQVVLAPLSALGVLLIAEVISFRRPALRVWWLRIVGGAALIAVLATLVINYRSTDQSRNSIARSFGEDLFATVAPDAILLANGDAIALPLVYLHTVEGMRRDVTFIIASLLPADWYVRQLRKHYSDLIVPFDHSDARNGSLKMLIEANKKRTFVLAGNLPDNERSVGDSYWRYPFGLVGIIEPKSKEFGLQEVVSDNERLLNRYKPPAPRSIRAKSFESDILFCYAQTAFCIGNEYERAGLKRDARNWYQRTFALHPDLPGVREALARIGP
jgi:hypothetical protein